MLVKVYNDWDAGNGFSRRAGMHRLMRFWRVRFRALCACRLSVEAGTRAAACPEYLAPYKERVIRLAAVAEQQEVRWQLAQLLARLDLTRSVGGPWRF